MGLRMIGLIPDEYMHSVYLVETGGGVLSLRGKIGVCMEGYGLALVYQAMELVMDEVCFSFSADYIRLFFTVHHLGLT